MALRFPPVTGMAVAMAAVLLLAGVASVRSAPLPVSSWEKSPNGVIFRLQPGLLRLQVCTDRIVRVTYSPTDALPDSKSVAVTKTWAPVPFAVQAAASDVTVATGELQVKIDRWTGALTFLDADGRVLLREDPRGGKKMTPTVVNREQTYAPEQTFLSPPDESLYGLGEFQDGLWNWRGIPLELRQYNTSIALPMLISSEGYGLLWDNASLTLFNPADQEIALPAPDQAAKPLRGALLTRTGTFTTGAAGDYVFFVRDANRSRDLELKVDGKRVGGVTNMWVPYNASAKVSLPAHTTCTLEVVNPGTTARLYARPLGDTTVFRSEVGDAIDYYFFYGPKVDDVVAGYRLATGAVPMLPEWAFGFWQCRERYSSQQQILDAARQFRDRRIPVDLIVQDWKYWGKYGWGAYQFDEGPYPDPAAMIQDLHDLHFKYMISAWSNPSSRRATPGSRNEVSLAAQAAGGLIGRSRWMDMFNPQIRRLRWRYMDQGFFRIGTDAWWQDATEPGDDGNALDGNRTFLGSGNRYRNAYPLFASEATYEGQRATTSAKRVVNLTRSAYLGQQRYGAISWSGDVNGTWDSLRRQIPAGLNFSITGNPYWTTDTGGFFHPPDQSTSPDYNELLTRWFEWSTFCPILRIHGWETETEMWKWLPDTQRNLLAYDELRYRMLPYNYSLAWMVSHDHYTFMRPLVMDFPDDAAARGIGSEYLFGPDLLVSPVTRPKATTWTVYLPAGSDWVNFWTGETVQGGREVASPAPIGQIPLFVRAGSILPLGPVRQYAMEKPADPIELRVYRGADGAFTLYEDEGDNYDYEQGAHATIPISWDDQKQELTLGARAGEFPGMLQERTFRIVWVKPGHGTGAAAATHADRQVRYDGKPLTVSPLS